MRTLRCFIGYSPSPFPSAALALEPPRDLGDEVGEAAQRRGAALQTTPMAYTRLVRFEWDPAKNAQNR